MAKNTKNANMIVFVDSKNSYTEIIQNIGRICRKNKDTTQLATILLPIMINSNKYKECKNVLEQDSVIRNEICKTGDFNAILNVLSALRQEDPYIFELCLNYPNVFVDKEINNNLEKYGLKMEDKIITINQLYANFGLVYDKSIWNFNLLSIMIKCNIQIITHIIDESDIIIIVS